MLCFLPTYYVNSLIRGSWINILKQKRVLHNAHCWFWGLRRDRKYLKVLAGKETFDRAFEKTNRLPYFMAFIIEKSLLDILFDGSDFFFWYCMFGVNLNYSSPFIQHHLQKKLVSGLLYT